MGGVECGFDVLGGAAGDLGEDLAVDRRDVLEVLALDRRDVLAADPMVVAGLVGNDASFGSRLGVDSHGVLLLCQVL